MWELGPTCQTDEFVNCRYDGQDSELKSVGIVIADLAVACWAYGAGKPTRDASRIVYNAFENGAHRCGGETLIGMHRATHELLNRAFSENVITAVSGREKLGEFVRKSLKPVCARDFHVYDYLVASATLRGLQNPGVVTAKYGNRITKTVADAQMALSLLINSPHRTGIINHLLVRTWPDMPLIPA